MRKIVLTYGLIAGSILAAMLLITSQFQDEIGFDNGAVIGYTTMLASFLMVYFGIRSYRDAHLNGKISFGRATRVGLLITVVSTACYVATWEFIYYRVAPDFGEKYAAAAIEKSKAEGRSPEYIAKQTADMAAFVENYKNPLVNIAITFLEPLPVGLLVTLISAGVLSRRPRLATSEAAR